MTADPPATNTTADDTNIPPSNTAPPPQPPQPPPPDKAHILVTGASSGLGRAFFEYFSSLPAATHAVRGIDARPYPTHPTASTCRVGACGTFNQVDLSAEPLVKKFVTNATVPGAAAPTHQSRSHSRSTSNSTNSAPPLASPTIFYRDRHHSQPRWPDSSDPVVDVVDYESFAAAAPKPPSSLVPPSTPPVSPGARRKYSSSHHQPAPQDADVPAPPYAGPFTLVIHSAGIRGLVPAHEVARPHDVAGAETVAAMDAATMRRAYDINTVATFTLVKALLPSWERLSSSSSSSPASSSSSRPSSPPPTSSSSSSSAAAAAAGVKPKAKPKFVVMASRMGSVGSNNPNNNNGSSNSIGGGAYAYRASKAALNAVVRSFSVDVPGVDFALVHPGRVETGLVRTKEEGAIGVGESVADVLRLIGRIGSGGRRRRREGGEEGKGEEGEGEEEEEEEGKMLESGCFVDRFGNAIPW